MEKKLRVWWIPQIGCESLYIPVETVEEGKKVMDILATYDCFLYNQNVRGDYCNTGGLQQYDPVSGEWNDWEYETKTEYFDDVDEYCETVSPQSKYLKSFTRALLEQVHFD